MTDIEIKARSDYKDLQKLLDCSVRYYGAESNILGRLYNVLNGHNLNLDDKMFDVNYKSICATVIQDEKGFRLGNSIEVWDENGFETIDIEEVKE